MVRCLDGLPDRSADLIKTLESVLQLSPQSDQARNDIIYLLLLDGQPTKDDLITAAQLDKDSPRYLSFRITAALAKLHEEQPAEALALLERDSIPWDRVRPGWQAIYAAALKANVAPVAPARFVPSLRHWYVSGPGPEAATERVAEPPDETETGSGCAVIVGPAIGAALTAKTALALFTEPPVLATLT